ncbi:MAG TPA: calcium/proton exchanger [Vicinamibacterales bacterium]|nr:calcium/proton exchanger [Vicinamibacterales bacterium]HPW20748.1 calcium/proton exchanger [Vicinamibacterales bacterium]
MAQAHAGGGLMGVLRRLAGQKVNLLLLAAPVSWALCALAPASPWTFVAGAVAIVPLAGLIGQATEELAKRSGPTLGGFLNATFGNAAELIIAFVALREGHIELVQATITGSIVGNLLLVFGLAELAGGIGRVSQRFDRRAAGNATIMLFLAVVALVMPAVFDLTVFGSLAPRPPAIYYLSVGTSILLIAAYVSSLVYAFRTNRALLRAVEPAAAPHWTVPQSVGVLGVATVLTAVGAEVLIQGLEPMLASFGWGELFTGVIVVAVIGNAAEHFSAVVAARRDQMTLAVEIAVGSSAQVALFVAPVLVLASFALGHPMTLLFHPLEIAAIGLSVLATAIVALDGESNWVEGLQLLALYAVLGMAFYFLPPG